MLKIYDHQVAGGQIYESIRNGFLDYAPGDKFREVPDIEDADVIFMTGVISNGSLSLHLSGQSVNLETLSYHANLYQNLVEKKRMIWLDTMGPLILEDGAIFDVLRETDILVSYYSLPREINTFGDVFPIEKGLFRERTRFERMKGSVVISHDNIINHTSAESNTPEVIAEVLQDVSHLSVTKSQGLQESVQTAFAGNLHKVSCENLSYPFGVANKLSQSEFILSTHTNLGIEFMGIEGGMCGCQPIYPDTPFYREVFDGTGVVFFDTENPVESLRSIIAAGSKFDEETTEAFRTRFSAENTLPNFWEDVYDLYA